MCCLTYRELSTEHNGVLFEEIFALAVEFYGCIGIVF